MPKVDTQGEGDAAFIDPSVVAGYYVSGFIPVEVFSYARTIQALKGWSTATSE